LTFEIKIIPFGKVSVQILHFFAFFELSFKNPLKPFNLKVFPLLKVCYSSGTNGIHLQRLLSVRLSPLRNNHWLCLAAVRGTPGLLHALNAKVFQVRFLYE
jgi:hypothetical protein